MEGRRWEGLGGVTEEMGRGRQPACYLIFFYCCYCCYCKNYLGLANAPREQEPHQEPSRPADE